MNEVLEMIRFLLTRIAQRDAEIGKLNAEIKELRDKKKGEGAK